MDEASNNHFTILLVDDQPEVLRELANFCETHFEQAKILQTARSSQALYIARMEQPDIILTDWDMPELTGLELLKHILEEPAIDNDVSVILCSGKNVSSKDLRRALSAGAADYIRKPFDHPELIARINSTLRDQRQLRQIKEAKGLLQQSKERNEALLQERINYQQLDIEALAIELRINREFNESIADKLDLVTSQHPAANKLVREFRFQLQSGERLQFLKSNLHDVNTAFQQKLLKRVPGLSAKDLELCALVRIGLSSKEVAAIKGVSLAGAKKSRQRLRKKLGLTIDQDIILFLKSVA